VEGAALRLSVDWIAHQLSPFIEGRVHRLLILLALYELVR
jgi:hypothetical protein